MVTASNGRGKLQAMNTYPENRCASYHAHVYFDANTLERARVLCRCAGDLFAVVVGKIHEKRVGPHPRWSCQIAFDAGQFDRLIAWLDENRNGLSILVHGLTGNDLADHSEHVSWLGEPVALNLSFFES